jgi:calcineurin-like phosphoesterase family protein
MSEVFIISDTHFAHRGILAFPATAPYRPFETIEEHDNELIERWNRVVSPLDTVYHLGDFCFGKRNLPIAGLLNGRKRLVMGNHDMYATEDYMKYFTHLYGCCEYKGMIFSHMPVHPNQFPRYYMNVHGHLHTNFVMLPDGQRDYRYFNASCENTDLTPVPLDEIFNYWAEHRG